MATVTSYTAERMKAIEDTTIVSGNISGNNLMLTRRNGTQLTAGNVRGPQGLPGATYTLCTSGTRPSGGSVYAGLAIFETDTKRIYIYDGTAWVYQNIVTLCTSTTRPASPLKGQRIYETDTSKELIYQSTTTGWTPPWNASWGQLANIIRSTNAGPFTTAEAIIGGMTITFTVPANRQVRMDAGLRSINMTVADAACFVRIKEGSTILQETQTITNSALAGSAAATTILITPTAGSHTYVLAAQASAGSGTIQAATTYPIFLYAYDVGPAGNPV